MLKVTWPLSLKCSPTAVFNYVLHSQAAVIYSLVYLKALLAAQNILVVALRSSGARGIIAVFTPPPSWHSIITTDNKL